MGRTIGGRMMTRIEFQTLPLEDEHGSSDRKQLSREWIHFEAGRTVA